MKRTFIFYAAALCAMLFTGCVVDFIESDIILKDSYVITFDMRGGFLDGPDEITEQQGRTIELPRPTYLGYTFAGWYSDPEGEQRFGDENGRYEVQDAVTMYARWMLKDPDNMVVEGIIYVFVEAGKFTMGCIDGDPDCFTDEVRREVTLSSFWISKYPITNRQFGRQVPANEWDLPAVGIDWEEAALFADDKGGRLPTEAQWEFAARGGNVSEDYIYSGSDVLDEVGWYVNNSSGTLWPAGQKLPNELGIYDMSGNVSEWCHDWYSAYNDDAVTNPEGPGEGIGRVTRGGNWQSEAREGRVTDRAYSDPLARSNRLGFRIVLKP
ncbi:MAG: SUMF1/EgtB/PvdO family nonheme iron enzyme [Chitinispirillales bacterium]|jgi:formylglycine-generating enzyme required for sulfatase activity|nr:SUMF1/EgtB/PvdO family nonheme iron enzyme [Chitinispirillales bacterium]